MSFFLGECSCPDCVELMNSFKNWDTEVLDLLLSYLLDDAKMNVRRARLVLISCEKSYNDICKLIWNVKMRDGK